MGVLDIVPAGVVSGKDVYKVFDYARENKFAIPAFNVTVSLTLIGRKRDSKQICSPFWATFRPSLSSQRNVVFRNVDS